MTPPRAAEAAPFTILTISPLSFVNSFWYILAKLRQFNFQSCHWCDQVSINSWWPFHYGSRGVCWTAWWPLREGVAPKLDLRVMRPHWAETHCLTFSSFYTPRMTKDTDSKPGIYAYQMPAGEEKEILLVFCLWGWSLIVDFPVVRSLFCLDLKWMYPNNIVNQHSCWASDQCEIRPAKTN